MGWNNGRGWNNNYNDRGYDRGYNNRNGGYNNNRGYDDRGYGNNRGGYDNSNLRLEEGTKCTLTYNPTKTVVIIRRGREQYECRDVDTLHIDWFYEHELEPVQE